MNTELKRVMLTGDHTLPSDLGTLVDRVNAEAIGYAARTEDVNQLQDWIAKGDNRMAIYVAKQIVQRQQQFTEVQANGLPADLQQLVDRVHAEATEYADRADDVKQLYDWIAKADHRMAIYVAKQIVQRQQQVREVQANGLPADLQQLVDRVHAEATEYADRADDVKQLNDWIAKADHRMAIYMAKQIVQRQQQFREVQANGLPADLQQLVDRVHAEAAEYADRSDDVKQLNDWIAKADHRMAIYMAKQIVQRQQQFGEVQANGLPADLQQLVDRVHAEATEYADRADDVKQLNDWIAKADHRMAIYVAKQVIERQQNIRSRTSGAA